MTDEEEGQKRLDAFKRIADYIGKIRTDADEALRLGIINTEKHNLLMSDCDELANSLWILAQAAGIRQLDEKKPFGEPGKN